MSPSTLRQPANPSQHHSRSLADLALPIALLVTARRWCSDREADISSVFSHCLRQLLYVSLSHAGLHRLQQPHLIAQIAPQCGPARLVAGPQLTETCHCCLSVSQYRWRLGLLIMPAGRMFRHSRGALQRSFRRPGRETSSEQFTCHLARIKISAFAH